MNDIQQQIMDAKLLIVDDEPANVAMLTALLQREGYANIESTTDSRQVFALYEKHCFDLILLDIRMPCLDGFQVMEQLAGHDPGDYLPILVMTAQTDIDTRLRALNLGAKDFISKPFNHAEALNRIGNMLEVRILYNQQRQQSEMLEIKVRERTRELEKTRLEIIHTLGRAAEYRDNETGMHIMRMSKCCQRLAMAAGLDEAASEMILDASPMHDVGKIGIPDHILLKPGKLTPEEWTIMQSHTDIGAGILGEQHHVDIMQVASSIALTHHEKWDGSGYPQGLKGEEIPIEGRIAAICDVFDALTSKRPYKQAWSVEKAMALIHEQAGHHFDPELVSLFDQLLPDILQIRERYTDND
jgi:putative two-component system response regulator